MALRWRTGSFWYWTSSWMIHALALCAVDIPVADAPPPEPARQPWVSASSADSSGRSLDARSSTVWISFLGEEDAISDLPLGGTGISDSFGAGGGGMAGLYGSGPVRQAKTACRPHFPPATEDASRAAADWLIRHQKPNGRWEPAAREAGVPEGATVPATALALLAIMESGATEQSRGCDRNVRCGLAWLTTQQHEDGAVFGHGAHRSAPTWEEYGHTLAAVALVEGDRRLRNESLWEPTRLALQSSLARHSSGLPGWKGGGDESVADHVCWHLTLLRCAREAGHFVSDKAVGKTGQLMVSMRRREVAPVGPRGRSAPWRGARVIEILAAGTQPDLGEAGLLLAPPAAPDWASRDLRAWRWSTLTAPLAGDAWQKWILKTAALLAHKQCRGGPRDGSKLDVDGSWEAPDGEDASVGPYRGRLFATVLGALILSGNHPQEQP